MKGCAFSRAATLKAGVIKGGGVKGGALKGGEKREARSLGENHTRVVNLRDYQCTMGTLPIDEAATATRSRR